MGPKSWINESKSQNLEATEYLYSNLGNGNKMHLSIHIICSKAKQIYEHFNQTTRQNDPTFPMNGKQSYGELLLH